ncbi:MAG: hypothetical protein JKP95_01860 [Oceanicaulis sp.]|nr:hypothetical protein [Oceanicaulis sp.]
MGYAERMLALHDEALSFRQGEARDMCAWERRKTSPRRICQGAGGVLRAHPGIQLEVTCDLTLNLMDMFHAGRLDVALVKREPSAAVDGQRVWSEPLVWVGADDSVFKNGRRHGAGGEPRALRLPQACCGGARTRRRPGACRLCLRLAGRGARQCSGAGLGVAVLPRDFPRMISPLTRARMRRSMTPRRCC